MRMLFALALLVLPAAAQAQQLATVGDFRRLPARTIADALLPKGHPPIADINFESPGNALGGIEWISFYSVARAVAHDFCAQDVIRVHVGLGDDDAVLTAMPRRIGNEEHETRYRYRSAAACDGRKPFFSVYLGPADWGLDAVRGLKAAVDLAARLPAGGSLPFELTCDHDIIANHCDGKAMLAELDLGEIDSVAIPAADQFHFYADLGKAAVREGDLFRFDLKEGGGVHIEVTMLAPGGEVTRVRMSRGIAIP